MEETPGHPRDDELRLRAEQRMDGEVSADDRPAAEASDRLVHELRVHQIELEMQNDELRRAQQVLDASRERYQELFDSAPVGYLTVDTAGVITAANQTAARLLGLERGFIVGAPVTRFIDARDQDLFYLSGRRLLTTDAPQSCELRLRRSATADEPQSTFWALLESTPAPEGNGSTDHRVTFSDVTTRHEAETRISDLNSNLEQRVSDRTHELTLANTELEQFVYSVAHDMRSPLRALAGFSHIVVNDYSDAIDEIGRGYLERIQAAAEHLGEVMDALLALSRINHADLLVHDVDVSALAREVAGQLLEADPDRVVDLRIQDGLVACFDEALGEVLLRNLLSNSLKFTAGVATAHISLDAAIIDGRRVFRVVDNGVGFDQAYADRLFQPFERLHSVREFAGTGIGLATVQRIVTRFHGECWAEAQVGEGATIFFTLPSPSDCD
jgi:PAS domain S-box-containing protein